MPKVSITLEFGSLAEASSFLSSTGSGGATGSTTISPSSPPPPPGNAPAAPPPGPPASAPPAPAASPPPMAAPPAPPTSAPPPAPPPAPAAAPMGGLQGEVLQAMQTWSKAGHKAAGIKRVLTKAGIASVSAQTPPATLEWLKWAFTTQDGSGQYLTPEYIESVQ